MQTGGQVGERQGIAFERYAAALVRGVRLRRPGVVS